MPKCSNEGCINILRILQVLAVYLAKSPQFLLLQASSSQPKSSCCSPVSAEAGKNDARHATAAKVRSSRLEQFERHVNVNSFGCDSEEL